MWEIQRKEICEKNVRKASFGIHDKLSSNPKLSYILAGVCESVCVAMAVWELCTHFPLLCPRSLPAKPPHEFCGFMNIAVSQGSGNRTLIFQAISPTVLFYFPPFYIAPFSLPFSFLFPSFFLTFFFCHSHHFFHHFIFFFAISSHFSTIFSHYFSWHLFTIFPTWLIFSPVSACFVLPFFPSFASSHFIIFLPFSVAIFSPFFQPGHLLTNFWLFCCHSFLPFFHSFINYFPTIFYFTNILTIFFLSFFIPFFPSLFFSPLIYSLFSYHIPLLSFHHSSHHLSGHVLTNTPIIFPTHSHHSHHHISCAIFSHHFSFPFFPNHFYITKD